MHYDAKIPTPPQKNPKTILRQLAFLTGPPPFQFDPSRGRRFHVHYFSKKIRITPNKCVFKGKESTGALFSGNTWCVRVTRTKLLLFPFLAKKEAAVCWFSPLVTPTRRGFFLVAKKNIPS